LVETQTDQLARAAWRVLQAIEAQGGVVRALESGYLAEAVARARTAAQDDVARRKIDLVGVSAFPDLSQADVAVEAVDQAAAPGWSPPAPAAGPNSSCPPLAPVRWAEPFEQLRSRAAMLSAPAGLAVLGPPAEHAARVGFARSLLAAGGVEAVELRPDTPPPPLVVLCGSDERYAAEAISASRELKARGVRRLWLAGRPAEYEEAWREAGVDGFIYTGCDVVAVLEDALAVLSVQRP
jgi:methylmalonyl-CoA mutase